MLSLTANLSASRQPQLGQQLPDYNTEHVEQSRGITGQEQKHLQPASAIHNRCFSSKGRECLFWELHKQDRSLMCHIRTCIAKNLASAGESGRYRKSILPGLQWRLFLVAALESCLTAAGP